MFSHPGNTGNLSFLISTILETLEVEVSNVLYNPGNTGNRFFLFSHILEIRTAGGRLQGLGSGGLGLSSEHVPGKMNMVTLELRSKHALFSKWLPRPNHYAHKICIEILSRTPVSILKYLSPGPQNHMKNSEYKSRAGMSKIINAETVIRCCI